MSSVVVEAVGAPVVPNLLRAMEAARADDTAAFIATLNNVAAVLAQLTPLLKRVHENLNPQVFYHKVRPFFAGSKSLPNGLIYEDGSGTEKRHYYGGGSAAQSPLFQFCDIALGIKHGRSGDDVNGFVTDMRNYMAGSHRKFLADVEATANVKDFVEIHESDLELATAYNNCLEMLKAFRHQHIGVVTRYIVIPSKAAERKNAEGVVANKKDCDEEDIAGTGGSALIPFLKQMRDETRV
jgi:indoleamine 2,3-dioxygenase